MGGGAGGIERQAREGSGAGITAGSAGEISGDDRRGDGGRAGDGVGGVAGPSGSETGTGGTWAGRDGLGGGSEPERGMVYERVSGGSGDRDWKRSGSGDGSG